ncbi:MAG: 3-phosphoshikimate 1-carboxyvinyltransferase [Clostridia bacterium]|nr:3-phosphoshikimate 1-carboxyvinyltransferase [Clostridia bacterium]
MNVTIFPSVARGAVKAPASKSVAHRMLIGAALAEGVSVLRGVTDSQDMLATLDGIAALGATYEKDGDTLTVCGVGGDLSRSAGRFPCRESGSTLRFLVPLALLREGTSVFTGSERLLARGADVYAEAFADKGITMRKTAGSVSFTGKLLPGDYAVRGDISSQYITGLLLALPLTGGASALRVTSPAESRPYIDITLGVLRRFGINVEETRKNEFLILPGRYRALTADVEGDWSNAAFFYALNALGGDVTVTGLSPDSLQGDRACAELLEQLKRGFAEIDVSDTPDLGPVLFAAAAALHGGRFTGTRRLAVKESDRAAAMAAELAKCGVKTEIEENAVTVFPGGLKKPTGPLRGHNDHRIVMALAVLLTRTGGSIEGAEAVGKSFPGFWEALGQLGVGIT